MLGKPGEFAVLADGQVVATRSTNRLARWIFGGWPHPAVVVQALRRRQQAAAAG